MAAFVALAVAALPATAAPMWETGKVDTGGASYAIGCGTPTRCYAISSGRIVTRDGNTVTSAPAPLPAGADPADVISLRSIACRGVDACIAVGSIFHEQFGTCCVHGLVEQISGGTVIASEVQPTPGFNDLGFSAISCVVVGACYAIGTESIVTAQAGGSVTSHTTPIYAYETPPGWTIRALPVRAGSISCPTSKTSVWCVALSATTIVTFSQGDVTHQRIPTPSGYFPSVEVDGLTCQSIGNCTFVGLDTRRAFPRIKRAVVGILHAGVWRVQVAYLPSDAAPGDALHVQPTGISCPGATHCVAVGSYWTSRRNITAGLLITRAGDALSVRAAPLPSGTSTKPPTGALDAISCPTVSSCDAVGVLGNRAIDDVWNGSGWRAAPIPSVAGQPSPSALRFGALNCPAVADCFATGGYAWQPDSNGEFQAFTEAYAIKS